MRNTRAKAFLRFLGSILIILGTIPAPFLLTFLVTSPLSITILDHLPYDNFHAVILLPVFCFWFCAYVVFMWTHALPFPKFPTALSLTFFTLSLANLDLTAFDVEVLKNAKHSENTSLPFAGAVIGSAVGLIGVFFSEYLYFTWLRWKRRRARKKIAMIKRMRSL